MAQVFQLNGSNLTYITGADWQPGAASAGLDGNTVRQRVTRHIWQANIMTIAEINTIQAQLGQPVNLTTTNYSDRNGAFISYSARFVALNWEHQANLAANVRAEFLVRV